MNRLDFLEEIGSRLIGSGVEFGAGASPFPVPTAHVRFADRNSPADLQARKYFGDSELIVPSFISDMENMEGIVPDSLDFIIASHVIEHTRSPLLAFERAYSRLRPGGRFVLVVPDKVATFDKERLLTPLAHVILDYEQPSRDRDWPHYVEFFEKAFPQPDPAAAAKGPFEEGHDIHFHTWTYESFMEMVEYSRRGISPWKQVWSHRRLSDQDIEFYFVLTK